MGTEPRNCDRPLRSNKGSGHCTQTTLDARPGGCAASFPRPAQPRRKEVIGCDYMSGRRKRAKRAKREGPRNCVSVSVISILFLPRKEEDKRALLASSSNGMVPLEPLRCCLLSPVPNFPVHSCPDGRSDTGYFPKPGVSQMPMAVDPVSDHQCSYLQLQFLLIQLVAQFSIAQARAVKLSVAERQVWVPLLQVVSYILSPPWSSSAKKPSYSV